MRLCDDCIYKNNCKEYQNKVIKTTPIDFDFVGCSDYKAMHKVIKTTPIDFDFVGCSDYKAMHKEGGKTNE